MSHSKYEVLLLANNCTDHTYLIAGEYQQAHPDFALHVAECWLPPKKAHIGTARRLVMDEAYNRFALLGKPRGIIASTDGDTEVDPTWVYHIIEEIQNGNDAVGGKILIKSSQNPAGTYHSLDETYRTLVARAESVLDPLDHDPWPRHFQYFGASLAVTCAMYEQAGRLPELPYLEDEAFYKALLCKDAKIRRSMAVKVVTSNRHEGRVCVGLSEQLRKWAQMEELLEPQLVTGAPEIIFRFTNRRVVRTCWKNFTLYGGYDVAALASVACGLGLVPHWVQQELENSRYFGQLWESIEQKMQWSGWHRPWDPVVIGKAIHDLEEFFRHRC